MSRNPLRVLLSVYGGLRLCFLPTVVLGGLTYSNPAAAAESPLALAVDSVGVTVGDLDRSVKFFHDVLTFELVSEREESGDEVERLDALFGARKRVARMKLGSEFIELTEYLTPRGRAMPPDSRGNDLWFQHIAIVVSDMEKAYARLRDHRVAHASTSHQRLPDWNPNAGGIRAFYFRDPDGHFLELIQFPEDKGEARWHGAHDALFLGIDHTAIVVGDTDTSLAYYRDELGMRVAGESENLGDEQEHLNSVFGARLRITALRAASGPGIELLEYLTPRDGRSPPPDSRPNDLWHWRVAIRTGDCAAVEELCIRSHRRLLSSRPVELKTEMAGVIHAIQILDPDGHALQFIDQSSAADASRLSASRRGAGAPVERKQFRGSWSDPHN